MLKLKIVAICNPNNPTGTGNSAQDMEAFLEALPEHVLVIVDEAYFEYADGPEYPQLVKKQW